MPCTADNIWQDRLLITMELARHKCSHRTFCSEFFTHISEHFRVYFRVYIVRSGYDWKDLFFLQRLSVDDANCGQRWGCQKWNIARSNNLAGTDINGLKLHIHFLIDDCFTLITKNWYWLLFVDYKFHAWIALKVILLSILQTLNLKWNKFVITFLNSSRSRVPLPSVSAS